MSRKKKPDMKEMSFMDHLDELRTRLIVILIAAAAGTVACFFISEWALQYLKKICDVELIALGPQDPLLIRMKISFVLGVVLACPVIFHQIWLFVAPGLYSHEKKYALPSIIAAVFLFITGAAFALYMIPFSLRILEKFGSGIVDFKYTLDKFVSFISGFVLAFGLVFQTPLVLLFLAKIGIVDYKFLARHRKYAIIIILIVGAILTPADVVSQMILSVPLYLLFEISLFLIRFTRSGRPESNN